jgi:hypothetical protein
LSEFVDEAVDTEESGDDFGYTADELAMFSNDNQEPVETEEVASEEPVEAESESPWDWAKDADPDKVRKTWEKFTDEWGKLAEIEKQYQPYMELANEIQSNPELAQHLMSFYERERTPLDELQGLKSEMQALRESMSIKESLEDLHKYVAQDEALPEVDDRELLEYAAQNGIRDLMTAYRNMTYDVVRQNSEQRAYDKIKKTKGAAVPKVGTADKAKAGTITQKAIDKMTDEEFANRYDEIAEFYAKGG